MVCGENVGRSSRSGCIATVFREVFFPAMCPIAVVFIYFTSLANLGYTRTKISSTIGTINHHWNNFVFNN